MIAASWVNKTVRVLSLACVFLSLCAIAAVAQTPVKFDSSTISGLAARNIGSARMSGRIAAVDAIYDKGRLTVFAASASGGGWESINGGTTFKSVRSEEHTYELQLLTNLVCRLLL